MMRWMAAILALAGCTPGTQTKPSSPAASSVDGDDTGVPTLMPCNETLVADQVGKRFDPARADAIRDRAKARTVRVVRPGDAVTMDFSPERLNIQLDDGSRMVEFRCG